MEEKIDSEGYQNTAEKMPIERIIYTIGKLNLNRDNSRVHTNPIFLISSTANHRYYNNNVIIALFVLPSSPPSPSFIFFSLSLYLEETLKNSALARILLIPSKERKRKYKRVDFFA